MMQINISAASTTQTVSESEQIADAVRILRSLADSLEHGNRPIKTRFINGVLTAAVEYS